MKIEIKIPPCGESVVEVTVSSIVKEEGSLVREGDEILEIETDKVNQLVYAPKSGELHWQVKQGSSVKVGDVVGFIEPKEVESAPSQKKVSTNKTKPEEEFFQESVSSEPKIESTQKKQGERREKMSSLRKTVAKRLVDAVQQTAMLTTFNEVDMTSVIAIREKKKGEFLEKHQVKLGFVSFFIMASLQALKKFPKVNAFIEGEEIVYHDFCDIGVAVSTEKGLLVFVLKDIEKLSLVEIEKKLKEFAEKAREGSISVDLLSGGTFTITNGGVFGSLLSTPILNPPQSAILGMHAIQKRPVVVEEKIEIRPMMYLALTYDHRIIDGKEAIQFLKEIKTFLEDAGLEKKLFP